MIPVVNKDPPEDTVFLEQAIRDRVGFVVPNIDASGFHSRFGKHFLIQCNASLIALYDKQAEQWFMRHDGIGREIVWTSGLVSIALDGISVIELNHKELKNVQRYGYVEVVRKRLNVK